MRNIALLNTPMIGKHTETDFLGTNARNAKFNFYNSFSQSLHNPRQFWSHPNVLFNKNSKVSINQLNVNNNTMVDSSIISNPFNEHFSSVSRTLHSTSHAMAGHVTSPPLNSLFSFRKMMPLDIYNLICTLKVRVVVLVEAKFAKLAAHILIYPLADLTSPCPHIVFPPYGSALELLPFSKAETQKM